MLPAAGVALHKHNVAILAAVEGAWQRPSVSWGGRGASLTDVFVHRKVHGLVWRGKGNDGVTQRAPRDDHVAPATAAVVAG